jgi:hypothetical protein
MQGFINALSSIHLSAILQAFGDHAIKYLINRTCNLSRTSDSNKVHVIYNRTVNI